MRIDPRRARLAASGCAATAARAAVVGIAVALLSACGGGGSGGHDLSVSFSYGASTSPQVFGSAGAQPIIAGLEGNAPHCSVQSGTLPPGITLETDCTLGGVVTRAGDYSAVIQLTANNYSGSVTTPLILDVPDIVLTPVAATATTPQAIPVGTPQSGLSLFAVANYTPVAGDVLLYTLASGAPPAGLAFDGASGTLNGTATTLGTAQIGVHLTLTRGNLSTTTADAELGLSVNEPALTLSYPNCCTASVGVPFSASPATSFAAASNATISYALGVDAQLPPGLALDPATGVISGVPTDYIPSVTPNVFTVVATAVLPTGSESATTMYTQIQERGVYPFYPVSSLGDATTYGSTPSYPEALSVLTRAGSTETWAPGTIYGGLPGDTYGFAIVASPFLPGAPPSWVSVDPVSGVVTASVPSVGIPAGTRFGLEITLVRNGVAYTQTQAWVFN